MKTILQNIIAVVVGLAAGGCANMTLIIVGPHVIPPPPGMNTTTVESLTASMHLLEPRHFVFPFLAHALGTLAAALVCFLIAASRRSLLAYAVGVVSLAGGIAAASMIPAPPWFIVLDLVFAYLPMAWVGIRLGQRLRGTAPAATP